MPRSIVFAAFGALLAAFVSVGFMLGAHLVLLLLAGATLLGAVALLWQSASHLTQHLSGETELTVADALHLAGPTALEERKAAVLRALKDLELEHSLGNITREDFLDLGERHRDEARRLLLELEEQREPAERRVEDLILKRLSPVQAGNPAPGPEAAPVAATSRHCGACATENDADAEFCKRCGTKLDLLEGDP